MYRPGTIITMDGTVMAILGYPVFPLIIEASSPAVNAPIKAAAAAGKDKSTSVSRNVFAMAPMHPALAAIFFELLKAKNIESLVHCHFKKEGAKKRCTMYTFIKLVNYNSPSIRIFNRSPLNTC